MAKNTKPSMAQQADKHVLYEKSVQNVEFEVDFLAKEFRKYRKRDSHSFREDFCGTAQAAIEWIKQSDTNTAIGVDLDGEVLAWAKERHVAHLHAHQQARLHLLQDNVLTVSTDKVDILAASNFSYWIFTTRTLMLDYFKNALAALQDDGVMFLDFFGGYEAHKELKEETEYDDFTYVWHQKKYNPYNHHMECRIHFKFPDGSKLKNAFRYNWRLWSLPEIRELLEEAGFSTIITYAEGWDYDAEEGNGVWEPTEKFDADPGWLAYIVALK